MRDQFPPRCFDFRTVIPVKVEGAEYGIQGGRREILFRFVRCRVGLALISRV